MITMIGTGYVGLVTAVCFARMGKKVCCIDKDEEKIRALNRGEVPFYEPGLEKLLKEALDGHLISFMTGLDFALKLTEICFISVGTPMRKDGTADLSAVFEVATEIGKKMSRSLYVVNKSTVPVGTAEEVERLIREEQEKGGRKVPFEVISNPEFLKEGNAVKDFMSPDRVIIGSENPEAVEAMKMLYAPFMLNHSRILVMDPRSAEMSKYAANAMLAARISFINEMANICEETGADVNRVREGIGSDPRIGYDFIYPGCGYGGSCFPKDVRALIQTAEENGYEPSLLKSVDRINENQKRNFALKIIRRFGEDLRGKIFSLWGLSFKPETDDMREAPSLVLIRELVQRGAFLKVYDPEAMDEAKKYLSRFSDSVRYCPNKYAALKDSWALILVTEWREFRSLYIEALKRDMKHPIIFDGRNQYERYNLPEKGFEYYPVGQGFKRAKDGT